MYDCRVRTEMEGDFCGILRRSSSPVGYNALGDERGGACGGGIQENPFCETH